jgi:hypothetical protein
MRLMPKCDDDQRPLNSALLTVTDVAALLRVPAKKVYALPIPRVTVSLRRVRFLESDVQAFIRSRRKG